ncbi:hypothetical protein Clacol_009082 [Clathrus columnatus]|uniref:Elongator complex protein 1 n=1 Tax=Clathrus columnatus TaxID=1419009 RepID=A0AAV5AQ33_9AGAM|nr:hypothetical protein Clacol_009082 [Clathrus columnatus]
MNTPLYSNLIHLPDVLNGHFITTLTTDSDTGKTYAVSEQLNGEDVNVQVWVVNEDQNMIPYLDSIFPAVDSITPQIICCSIIPDTRSICLILRSGDIAITYLEHDNGLSSFDIVGTISPGPVSAAVFSPDYSRLAVVTSISTPTLMLMDPTSFEVLSSAPIITSDFGEDAPINVGWGSKATQFHGTLGKQAAKASIVPDRSTSTPDDDLNPRISWRGDAKYFVVSLFQDDRRVLRVYDHQAKLQNTAQNVAGLEHPLAWRPNGSLIASTQRFGNVPNSDQNENWALEKGQEGRHDVVFFERNGLRHGEFHLRERKLTQKSVIPFRRWGYRVHNLAWNADSSILIQLWTTGNYHWYLKLEFPASGDSKRFTTMLWHPEDPFRLLCATKGPLSSTSLPPYDTGLLTVVDGDSLLLTPFRTQNVPPPMSSCQLPLSNPNQISPPPIDIAFSTKTPQTSTTDFMTCLFAGGIIKLWCIRTNITHKLGKNDPLSITELWNGRIHETDLTKFTLYRQIGLVPHHETGWTIAIVSNENGKDKLICIDLRQEGEEKLVLETQREINLPEGRGRLVDSSNTLIWQTADGMLFEVEDASISPFGSFSEFCQIASEVRAPSHPARILIGQKSSKLIATADLPGVKKPLTLSRSCTSYCIAGNYLVWTATSPSHEAVFCQLDTLLDLLKKDPETSTSNDVVSPDSFEKRRIERGARIVTSVPSQTTLVLQMPRGNLETIMPRPLVIDQVKIDVKNKNYRSAFLACRKHRVGINLLVEIDPKEFMENIPTRSELSPELINSICDRIRENFEHINIQKFVDSILTAYIVKKPSDYEAGLSFLLKLRENHPDLVEDAVKYIVFLVDVDKLFDTALGMYDFSLVLLVAQYSKKDPREYLPFLRSLHSLEIPYQYFKIDDYLKRYPKALKSLQLSGSDHFEEAKAYVEKHNLYKDALNLWKHDHDRFKAMLELYGDYLFDRREFKEAALAFMRSSNKGKYMVALEKALEWQDLFDTAYAENLDKEEISSIAYRVAENLSAKQRHIEAARVFMDYLNDIDQAVSCLVKGAAWSEARRIISLNDRHDLLEFSFSTGTLEAQSSIRGEIAEIQELLEKQTGRLDELSAKRLNEPDTFFGAEDPSLGNIDVMTDASNPGTLFTRYTVAPTASDRSKRTSRSKRKLDRKAGRKGTIQEEEYLLTSVTKLFARLETVKADTKMLLPHLVQLSEEHMEAAESLQKELSDLEERLRTGSDQIWGAREDVTVPIDQFQKGNTATSESEIVKLIHKVPKPVLSDTTWKISWLGL